MESPLFRSVDGRLVNIMACGKTALEPVNFRMRCSEQSAVRSDTLIRRPVMPVSAATDSDLYIQYERGNAIERPDDDSEPGENPGQCEPSARKGLVNAGRSHSRHDPAIAAD